MTFRRTTSSAASTSFLLSAAGHTMSTEAVSPP